MGFSASLLVPILIFNDYLMNVWCLGVDASNCVNDLRSTFVHASMHVHMYECSQAFMGTHFILATLRPCGMSTKYEQDHLLI